MRGTQIFVRNKPIIENNSFKQNFWLSFLNANFMSNSFSNVSYQNFAQRTMIKTRCLFFFLFFPEKQLWLVIVCALVIVSNWTCFIWRAAITQREQNCPDWQVSGHLFSSGVPFKAWSKHIWQWINHFILNLAAIFFARLILFDAFTIY